MGILCSFNGFSPLLGFEGDEENTKNDTSHFGVHFLVVNHGFLSVAMSGFCNHPQYFISWPNPEGSSAEGAHAAAPRRVGQVSPWGWGARLG